MMIITGRDKRAGSWHTGENMNIPEGYVVTFQADGHELDWLLSAIREALRAEDLAMNWAAKQLTPIL